MAAPKWDYIALKVLPERGPRGYNPGDGMMQQVVDNLGLVVGVDVKPARPDMIARPAGNAPRADWYVYALGQDKTPEELDDLGRDQIRDLFPAEPAPEQAVEAEVSGDGTGEALPPVDENNPDAEREAGPETTPAGKTSRKRT